MPPIFKSIFLFSCCLFIFGECETNVCSKVYILPMFSQNSMCGMKFGSSINCTHIMNSYLNLCAFETKSRSMISIFNFTNSTVYSCAFVTKSIVMTCSAAYSRKNILTLQQNKNYSIWDKFIDQVEKDKRMSCFNNQLAIFVTDIPYEDFSSYPDLNQLFDVNLKETLIELFDLKLHAYFVFIQPPENEDQSFGELEDLKKFTETDNLKFLRMSFAEFLHTNDKTKLCGKEKFPDPPRPSLPPDNTMLEMIVGIVCGVVFLLIIFYIIFWMQRVWRRWKESKIEAFADQHAKSAKHILFGKYLDEWEVTPKELKVDAGTVLGQGMFGKVYLGHLKKTRNKEWIEMEVAVKFSHDNSDEKIRQEMIEEIGFMKKMGSHENLLVMVGYVKSIENPIICTVYCSNGSLLSVLQKHPIHFMSQNKCSEVEICLLLSDLLKISIEVCSGLVHLSSLNYVHRDIAARNVLLTDKMVAKLGDFGLCKQMEDGHDFLIEKEGKFPIKYMPFESIKFGEFSTKSDVWSFGILIWEMLSGGERPFDSIEFNQFVDFLDSNGKPEFSEDVPQPLAQLLNEKVFQKYPSKRATFVELKSDLYSFYSVICSVLKDQENRSDYFKSNRGSIRHRN